MEEIRQELEAGKIERVEKDLTPICDEMTALLLKSYNAKEQDKILTNIRDNIVEHYRNKLEEANRLSKKYAEDLNEIEIYNKTNNSSYGNNVA